MSFRPSNPAADFSATGAGEPPAVSPVRGPAVEENMADDTPWARFYRQQASGAATPTVSRLLDSWKTRRTLGDRDVADGDGRSLRR